MMARVFVLLGVIAILPAASFGEQSSAALSGHRDPFRFVNRVPLGLNMVYLKDDEKTAIINGKEYRVGDRIGESKITTIDIDYVELTYANGKWRMYVK